MKQKMEREFIQRIKFLLKDSGLLATRKAENELSSLQFEQLTGDGSSRRFVRVSEKGRVLCLAAAPGKGAERNIKEARSARLIGKHLHRVGVPVPDQYGYDEEFGIILFEDLGDLKLHEQVQTIRKNDQSQDVKEVPLLYRQVIDQLINMQIQGSKGFDPGWCWDTTYYDLEVMTRRESGYFCRTFVEELTSQKLPAGLEEECVELARICTEEEPGYFLHRDFQSRNIMIQDGRIRIIDYQGGRFGPIQYDMASLLIDPYVGLSAAVQAELLDYFVGLAEEKTGLDGARLKRYYPYLALQRNLQIIGAFSFLGYQRNKHFFRQFLYPSLVMLNDRLSESCFVIFPTLGKITQASINLLQRSAKFVPIG